MMLSGTNVAVPGWNQAFETLKSKLEQAFAPDKGDELLGKPGPAHRPKPGSGPAGDNQCVSHPRIFPANDA
jgi:hypothetical protein